MPSFSQSSPRHDRRSVHRDFSDLIRFAAHGEVIQSFYLFKLVLVFCVTSLMSSSSFGAALIGGDEYTVWPDPKPGFDYKKPPESLCNLDKEIISFTCELANNETVSVCASRDLTAHAGYIVYRYGLPGKIELVYPKKLVDPREFFFYSNIWAQSGGKTSLSFFNKPYKYSVFADWDAKIDGIKGYRAGVSISNWDNWDAKNGHKIVFQKMCKGNSYYTTAVTTDTPLGLGTGFVFDALNFRADVYFVDKAVANESGK